eukprot:TRINITY_DN10415_c0_g1_i1.p2 TRINITY_DN10415_c0_g1~~TRINITY_DN10415_c0_g1_i1.p2  ORF type:complete len:130 (+),score=3.64 TRINITY_DN10415_c0_g1_i1:257-646(+)
MGLVGWENVRGGQWKGLKIKKPKGIVEMPVKIPCYICGGVGHWSNKCLQRRRVDSFCFRCVRWGHEVKHCAETRDAFQSLLASTVQRKRRGLLLLQEPRTHRALLPDTVQWVLRKVPTVQPLHAQLPQA